MNSSAHHAAHTAAAATKSFGISNGGFWILETAFIRVLAHLLFLPNVAMRFLNLTCSSAHLDCQSAHF